MKKQKVIFQKFQEKLGTNVVKDHPKKALLNAAKVHPKKEALNVVEVHQKEEHLKEKSKRKVNYA